MKQMTPQDIVKNSREVKESGADWKQLYAGIAQGIEENKYRVMRSGNTLFMYKLVADGEAQMFIISAEPYKELLRNTKNFAKAMDKAGFKKVYGETHDINIIRLIERMGYPMTVERLGKDDKGRQIYRGTVNV
jgi:hypothetical protein